VPYNKSDTKKLKRRLKIMKRMLMVTLLPISLILAITPIGYGANPGLPAPPGYEYGQYVGPDVTGSVTFIENVDGSVNMSFYGSCKNNIIEFNASPLGGPGFFEMITPEWLLGTCDDCVGPQELSFVESYPTCSSSNKDAYLFPVVYKVKKFVENGNTKSADIIGRFPVFVLIK
jgi:hypothetical protein